MSFVNFLNRMFLKSTPMFFWGLTVYRKNIDNFVESFNIGDNRQKRLKGTPSLSLKMSMEFHLLNLKQANGALNNNFFFQNPSFEVPLFYRYPWPPTFLRTWCHSTSSYSYVTIWAKPKCGKNFHKTAWLIPQNCANKG